MGVQLRELHVACEEARASVLHEKMALEGKLRQLERQQNEVVSEQLEKEAAAQSTLQEAKADLVAKTAQCASAEDSWRSSSRKSSSSVGQWPGCGRLTPSVTSFEPRTQR